MSGIENGGNVMPYDIGVMTGANSDTTQPPMVGEQRVREAQRLMGVYEMSLDTHDGSQPDLVDGIPANWKVSPLHRDIVRGVVAGKIAERAQAKPSEPGGTMPIDVPETLIFKDVLVTLDRVPTIHDVEIGNGTRAVVVPIGLKTVLRALMSGRHIDATATRLVAHAFAEWETTPPAEPEV